jgi:hypothetical protein
MVVRGSTENICLKTIQAVMEIQTDECGFKFYTQVPDGFKPAEIADFYLLVKEYDEEGAIVSEEFKLKLDYAFLVQSFHNERYYAQRVRETFNPEGMHPWFAANKVFIHVNSN